jgi:hypothetical protein
MPVFKYFASKQQKGVEQPVYNANIDMIYDSNKTKYGRSLTPFFLIL